MRTNSPTADIFARLKENLSISAVTTTYGVEMNRHNKALCPFHEESTPSLTIYPDTNSFYCFGCNTGGDAISFVGQLFELEPLEAARKLDEDFQLGLLAEKLTPEMKREMAEAIKQREAEQRFIQSLEEWAEGAFNTLCLCHGLMQEDAVQYAPKSVEDEYHPRFIAACHWKDYVQYLINELMYADFEGKLNFYNELESEVCQLAEYARESTNEDDE